VSLKATWFRDQLRKRASEVSRLPHCHGCLLRSERRMCKQGSGGGHHVRGHRTGISDAKYQGQTTNTFPRRTPDKPRASGIKRGPERSKDPLPPPQATQSPARSWLACATSRPQRSATAALIGRTRGPNQSGNSDSSQTRSLSRRRPTDMVSTPCRNSPSVNTLMCKLSSGVLANQATTPAFGLGRTSSDRTLVSSK
jgi:hypothetical protein